jgi:hypothetical protein
MSVPRPRIFLVLAALLGCVTAVTAAAYIYKSKAAALEARPVPELVGQLPSDAPALAYIDVAAIRQLNQQALTDLLQKNAGKNGQSGDNDYQKFVDATGFDFSRDLDHVAVAFWPAPSVPASESNVRRAPGAPPLPQPRSQAPTLAIADGRFDRAKIEAYALRSGHAEHVGNTQLLEIPGDPPVALRFLSASRIEMASGKQAMDRLAADDPPGPSPSIRELVERVGGSPVFAVAEAAPFSGNVANTGGGAMPNPASFAKDIRAMTFAGQPSGGGFDIIFEGKCDSANSAAGMIGVLTAVRGFGSAMLADPKSRGKMTQEQVDAATTLLSQIKIQQDDLWVGITVHITPEMMAAATKQANAAKPH